MEKETHCQNQWDTRKAAERDGYAYKCIATHSKRELTSEKKEMKNNF